MDANISFWSNPVFSRFWQHYYESKKWCHKHWNVSNSIEEPQLVAPRCRRRRAKKSKSKKSKMASAKNDEVGNKPQGDEEMEIELDEDYVKFLSSSIKHRIERDKDKKSSNINDESSWAATLDDYIRVDRIGVNRKIIGKVESLLPPTQAIGEERTKEMKVLYGDNADRIQSLETLMQVYFDADFDKFQPPLWPNMPFKL